ncbi:hypothetical protein EOM81_11360 [bacterium]|nr:hypothetical protein [bacterium]
MNKEWKNIHSAVEIQHEECLYSLQLCHSGHEYDAVYGSEFAAASDSDFAIDIKPISGTCEGLPLTMQELKEFIRAYEDVIIEKLMEVFDD